MKVDPESFVQEAIFKLPADYGQKLGFTIESSVETFKKGDLYILGTNSGGGGIAGHTIIKDLQDWPHRKGKCNYTEGKWSDKYCEGCHPIQKHLKDVVATLGYDIRTVFGSNLIFRATRRQNKLQFMDEAIICWRVHEIVMPVIDPNILVVFGNGAISPFSFLKYKALDPHDLPEYSPKWCAIKKCKAFKGIIVGRERIVIGLPHLSYFSLVKKDFPDALEWLKSAAK